MAYNPFNIFRRNQKALFAVLTVFIMVMFTLQSGVVGGDAIENFARWLGARGSKDPVCRLDGSNVSAAELEGPKGLQFKRQLANRFMYFAAEQSVNALREYANQQHSKLSPAGQELTKNASETFGSFQMLPMFRNNPQVLQQVEMQVRQVRREIALMLGAPGAKAEDREVARYFQTAFNLQELLFVSRDEHYFIGAPNRSRRDLLEFMLWQKKADQLGIKFSEKDVASLIVAEFDGAFRAQAEANVRRYLQNTPGFTMSATMEAIGEEFRVRAAQSAVLGHESRRGRAPGLATPYEAFEYYREQTSPSTYEVIPVPAQGFLSKVTTEPTQAEIDALYRKYKDDEPNPRRETPGFKEPRKIKVAFFGITGEEPYYKKLAEEQLKVGEALAKLSGAFTVPVPGAGGGWAAVASGAANLKDPALTAAYETYKREFEATVGFKYTRQLFGLGDVLDSNWSKPGAAAAAVGAFGGHALGFGHPAAGAALAAAAPFAYEARDRAKAGVPLVLAPGTGPALLPGAIAGAAASKLNEPHPQSLEAKRPELLKGATEARAKALALGEKPGFTNQSRALEKGDLQRFIDELQKLSDNGKPKDQAAVDKYIKEFLATRGITTSGQSTGAHSEWTIEEDAGLRPLIEAHKESLARAKGLRAHGLSEPYIPFGGSFFWTVRFDMNGQRRVPATGTYLGQTFPADDMTFGAPEGRTRYVYWRTEDKPAAGLSDGDARPAVVAAWKRAKARELAKARADQLADAVRAFGSSDTAVVLPFLYDRASEVRRDFIDPKALKQANQFTLGGVSPLVTGMQGLSRYFLPASENLPYPTDEMEKALLDNRDKPLKTVLVLPDAAKDVYYVATLVRRDLKRPDDFRIEVTSTFATARAVLTLQQEDAAVKARKSVLDLLKKEFRYEESEEQKKKLDEQAKSGNRDL
jgi:hypothetical protein